jgi:hypothetical protein
MESAARLPDVVARCDKSRIAKKTSILDGSRNSNEILHHNAPGAQIQVTDLAVAYLPAGKANPET